MDFHKYSTVIRQKKTLYCWQWVDEHVLRPIQNLGQVGNKQIKSTEEIYMWEVIELRMSRIMES